MEKDSQQSTDNDSAAQDDNTIYLDIVGGVNTIHLILLLHLILLFLRAYLLLNMKNLPTLLQL